LALSAAEPVSSASASATAGKVLGLLLLRFSPAV
jgi:hypothetical protein